MRVLVASLLLAFACDAFAHEPPADALLATVPFLEYPEPHRVVVDLAPEGRRPLVFIVDTGATHTVATPRAAAELGIRVRRHKRDPYRRKTRLGRDVQILVDARSSDTASKTGWEYALLGGQFLSHYVVEFDFGFRRMRFFDRKKYEIPEQVDAPDEVVLPLRMRQNRPAVETRIQGRPTLTLIDTGAQPPLVVSGKVADAADLARSAGERFEMHGVMGAMTAELARTDPLELGPFRFAGVPTIVLPKGWYNQGLSSGSVIGYELLAQFTVRLDYARKRMWLKRRERAQLTFGGEPVVPVAADD
ncbi:MAG: hypothetical protein HKP30_18200 [Myxococcales bacterium]|nr:hypothetical protein [Myxococcales bacterium]